MRYHDFEAYSGQHFPLIQKLLLLEMNLQKVKIQNKLIIGNVVDHQSVNE